MRKEANKTIMSNQKSKMKLKGPGWGAGGGVSPNKIRPQEQNFRTKSPSKKMGHSKTVSLVDRLYSGNSRDKHCSPPKKVKKNETVENNEKVLKYLEDSLAVFESKVQ